MSMSNSDSRKRLAEAAATPPAQDKTEALARVMHDTYEDGRDLDGWRSIARAVLTAGYLPPAEVARLVQEARRTRLDDDTVCDLGDFIADERDRLPRDPGDLDSQVLASAIADWLTARPVSGERSEAGA